MLFYFAFFFNFSQCIKPGKVLENKLVLVDVVVVVTLRSMRLSLFGAR